MKKWMLLVGLFACSQSVLANDKVTIYAASSMTNAVTDLVSAYESESGDKVVTVFGGSSSLARQIEQGAPADVFLSANEKWVNYLIDKDLVDPSRVQLLAGNQLALIKPSNSQQEEFDVSDKQQWKSILSGSRMAVGYTDSVPVGIYTKEALENLGVWDTVEPTLAQTKNVRAALSLVERGESPLGIVYKTDALLTPKVKTLMLLDPKLYGTIHYPLVQLTDSKASAGLVKFMSSSEAKVILDKYGFRTDMGNEKFAQ